MCVNLWISDVGVDIRYACVDIKNVCVDITYVCVDISSVYKMSGEPENVREMN